MLAWIEYRSPAVSLRVSPPLADLGAVKSRGTYSCDFRLENDGRQTIEILSVENSCTCTVAHIEHARIEVGHSSKLAAKLSVGERTGPINSAVFLVYRATGAAKVYRLTIGISCVAQ